MPIPKLTESMIQALASPESFQRGREYYEGGAIFNAALQGDVLLGECEGSSAPSYRIRIQLDSAGIREAECTCPYDWGGFCKHIVALLLAHVHDRKQFAVRAQAAELLADLDRDDLVALLDKLLKEQPDLYDRVAAITPALRAGASVAAPAPARQGKAKRHKAVDLDVYRRRVIGILHSLDGMRSSEAYWHVGSLVNQLAEVEATAMRFLEAGEPRAALDILLTLLEEASHGFETIDDSDGNLGSFLAELGEPLAETILSQEPKPAERTKLVRRLAQLDHQLADYGLEQTLSLAIQAAEQGWEKPTGDPPAQRTAGQRRLNRRGVSPPQKSDDWDDEDAEWLEDDFDDDEDVEHERDFGNLTDVQLNILSRRGEIETYLQLCLETGRHLRYVLKLAEVGRIPEAMKHARQHLQSASDALALAESLRARNAVAEAIDIGEWGLKGAGPMYALAAWLAPVEEAHGRTEAALRAWQAAFAEQPSLAIYQAIKRLAGTRWKKLGPEVMTSLRRSGDKRVLAEVLIEAQDWDEAIQVADGRPVGYDVVEIVADAVLPHRPAWVAETSRKHAERLMVEPKSQNYPLAAAWLKRAKKAQAALCQTAEWLAYLDRVKEQYRRRPALQAQLNRL
jgi:uncharacterized Zn finger protein